MPTRALFLDRDGTIIEDRGFLNDPDGVALLPGTADALRFAQSAGYRLIVHTNQSGIARGLVTKEQLDAVNQRMRDLLAMEGVHIDAIYHCPHGPDSHCECRKPRPGMILQAAREHDIDLAQSLSIGDKPRDIEAAMAAGVGMNLGLGEGPHPDGAVHCANWCEAAQRLRAVVAEQAEDATRDE